MFLFGENGLSAEVLTRPDCWQTAVKERLSQENWKVGGVKNKLGALSAAAPTGRHTISR